MMRVATLLLAATFWSAQFCMSQAKVRSHLLQTNESPSVDPSPVVFDEEPPAEKSVWLAVGYSLLLPGMGELYAGTFNTGKYSTMAEGALWMTYAAFISHGNWLRDDARSFAVEHASVQLGGKDDKFLVDVGNYGTLDDYNQQKLRNREFDQVYSGPDYSWRWDNDANRDAFRTMRIRSDETFRNSRFLLGAAVLNRIVSAFLAGRAVAAYNRRVRYEGAWQFRVYPSDGLLSTHGLELRVSKEF